MLCLYIHRDRDTVEPATTLKLKYLVELLLLLLLCVDSVASLQLQLQVDVANLLSAINSKLFICSF